MRLLLLGKGGQIGWELQRSLASLGELIALDRASVEYCGDLNQPEGLARTIAAIRPDVIVNAAAYTAVDNAESNPEMAHTLNAIAPGILAQIAFEIEALLVHYSTDYVFDGSGEEPWQESDVPAPLNIYGQTKLAGEKLVASRCPNHLIFRTSWVYGARGKNFAKTMLHLAQERSALNVIDDQFGAPTGAELLADATAHAIRDTLREPAKAGLYHLAADGETSWHGYARFVIQKATDLGLLLKTSPDSVRRVPSRAYPSPARRPQNSRLNTSKFRQSFNLVLPPWELGVTRMLKEMLKHEN